MKLTEKHCIRQNVSTGKTQHKDQGFKRSFYYIRLDAHTCLRGDATQTFSGIVDSPKDVASSGSSSHYWNNHNEAEASKEKKKSCEINVFIYTFPKHNSPNDHNICLLENTLVDSKLSYLFCLCHLETQGILHYLSVRFLYQILWLQRFY